MNAYAVSIPQRAVRSFAWLLGATMMFIALLTLQNAASAGQPAATQDRIVALAFDHASRTLFKATSTALSRSGDEGRTWTPIALPPTAAKGNIATVSVSARDRNAIYVAGAGLGVLRSKDGGQRWAPVNKGLPSRPAVALSTHAEQADTVYAYVDGKGIYRSQDGGANWRLMDRGPRDRIVHFVHSNMPGSMETGWLFAATSKGVRRSMDCFCGWHHAGEVTGKFHAVSYDPDQPERVYAAAREGLFVSTDGGEQWTRMKSPAAGVTALVATSSGGLYAAAAGKLFRSRDRGVTWENADA